MASTTPPPARPAPLPHGLHQPAPDTAGLEQALSQVETAIDALTLALQQADGTQVELASLDLRAAMGSAMTHFAQVARRGTMPPALRQRLALASAKLVVQRDAVGRQSAALDQAIDILIPREQPAATYTPHGNGRGGPGRVIAAS